MAYVYVLLTVAQYLLSVGSMLAIDQPFIASSSESDVETNESICLEYGSATQLYLVPFVGQGEQVRPFFF